MKPTAKLRPELVARALRGWSLTQHQVNVLLRACITASPGNTLVAADYSQVEARALAWAAGDEAAVAVFRTGADPYARLACRLFGIDPSIFDKKIHAQQRDTAKKIELAGGYGMGAPKFVVTAEKGGMVWNAPELCPGRGEQCDDPVCGAIAWTRARGRNPAQPYTHGAQTIVTVWRETHAPIVEFWDELKWAAVTATQGERCSAGPYEWARVDGATWCMLPSGRPLVYNGMRVENKDLTYQDPATGFEKRTYGGSLSENVTQAFCRDLLARALVGAEDAGLCPVLHVHDEIVCDVPKEMGADALELLELIMGDLPPWAEGFPMKVEGFVSERYRK